MVSDMKILNTPITGVVVIETNLLVDHRGSFARLFCERELAQVLGKRRIVQINHSRTTTVGTIRGMHYQRPPHAEIKLVRCLRGKVWDVAVDLRTSSLTFLRWHAEELTPENGRMLVIPEGFAHGFQVLEPDSELLYLHTSFYAADAEGGIPCDDPETGITWPLPISQLSDRDRCHAPITQDFKGIVV